MAYQRPQISASGSAKAPLVPKGVYRVAVLAIDRSQSKSSGAAMITTDVQILAPEEVTIPDGRVVKTAGVRGKLRFAFTEANLANIIDACTKLGVKMPPAAATFDEDVAAISDALAARLNTLTFEMVVESKVAPQTGAANEPLKDSLGNVIMRESIDFALFGIAGVPRTFQELGITMQSGPA